MLLHGLGLPFKQRLDDGIACLPALTDASNGQCCDAIRINCAAACPTCGFGPVRVFVHVCVRQPATLLLSGFCCGGLLTFFRTKLLLNRACKDDVAVDVRTMISRSNERVSAQNLYNYKTPTKHMTPHMHMPRCLSAFKNSSTRVTQPPSKNTLIDDLWGKLIASPFHASNEGRPPSRPFPPPDIVRRALSSPSVIQCEHGRTMAWVSATEGRRLSGS